MKLEIRGAVPMSNLEWYKALVAFLETYNLRVSNYNYVLSHWLLCLKRGKKM